MEPKPIGALIRKQEKDLSLISRFESEEEEFILSPEEAEEVAKHWLDGEQKKIRYTFERRGFSHNEIEGKVNDIDWEEKWKDAGPHVLRKSNSRKHYQLWEKEQRASEKKIIEQEREALKLLWTSKNMFRYLRHVSKEEYGQELIVNDKTLPLIKALCYFLSGDERFESELGYDLKKGLLIRGESDRGKTFIVDCLKRNALNPVSLHSMISITEDIKNDNGVMPFFTDGYLGLDDVGTEETPVKKFGTVYNWFKDFIELRYFHKSNFNKIIISSNMNFQGVEDKYGFRVVRRMKVMFNVVNV